MKSTIVALLAAASVVSGRATPRATQSKVNRYKTEYLRIPHVPHPDRVDVSQVCIDFVSDVDWYYLLAPPWGTTSGYNPSQVCVPTSNGAGGGMFVGPEPAPNANSTKIEFFFPSSGSTPANGDISLVNGYSLSVTCTMGDLTIGGPFDGFTNGGTPCGHVSGVNCANAEGPYASSVGQVSGFFQPAASTSGNNYCIWDLCPNQTNDPSFPVSEQITCTIAGGM